MQRYSSFLFILLHVLVHASSARYPFGTQELLGVAARGECDCETNQLCLPVQISIHMN